MARQKNKQKHFLPSSSPIPSNKSTDDGKEATEIVAEITKSIHDKYANMEETIISQAKECMRNIHQEQNDELCNSQKDELNNLVTTFKAIDEQINLRTSIYKEISNEEMKVKKDIEDFLNWLIDDLVEANKKIIMDSTDGIKVEMSKQANCAARAEIVSVDKDDIVKKGAKGRESDVTLVDNE